MTNFDLCVATGAPGKGGRVGVGTALATALGPCRGSWSGAASCSETDWAHLQNVEARNVEQDIAAMVPASSVRDHDDAEVDNE